MPFVKTTTVMAGFLLIFIKNEISFGAILTALNANQATHVYSAGLPGNVIGPDLAALNCCKQNGLQRLLQALRFPPLSTERVKAS
jgi:hypothetical protein